MFINTSVFSTISAKNRYKKMASVAARVGAKLKHIQPVFLLLVVAVAYNIARPLPTYSDYDVSVEDLMALSAVAQEAEAPVDPKTGFPEVDKATPRVLETRTVSKVTYYASTPGQTSGNPFITASGSHVHWGTVASNCFPFGTRIRIPELYGDQIFIVEDRHSTRYGCGLVDVWTDYSAGQNAGNGYNVTVEVIEHIPGVN